MKVLPSLARTNLSPLWHRLFNVSSPPGTLINGQLLSQRVQSFSLADVKLKLTRASGFGDRKSHALVRVTS